MEDLKILLDYVVIPLLYVLYRQEKRLTTLEAQQITKTDLEKIYNELKEIRNEIHEKAENYVHHNQCVNSACKK